MEDNSWFEISDGSIQCDHSIRPKLEQIPDIDIALVVSEYRDKSGARFGQPEISIYCPGVSVEPVLIKMLLQELTDLLEIANVAVQVQSDLEQCS